MSADYDEKESESNLMTAVDMEDIWSEEQKNFDACRRITGMRLYSMDCS